MTFRDFLADERATVSVDAVIIMPGLLLLYAYSFIWWDGYKTSMTAQKASYTISDIISREPATINQAYLNGMNQMFDFLTNETGSSSVRVSVVRQELAADGVTEELQLQWSNVSGTKFAPHADMTDLAPHIPILGLGDEMIVVETHMSWTPLSSVGTIAPTDATVIVTTSPRFGSPQVLWSSG